jgi:uncharacterized membrane protein YgdD (TMEM256/DUF423 family)
MNQSKTIKIAALSGALSVILGAFGAHILKEKLHLDNDKLAIFETAVRYQFYHTLALLCIAAFPSTLYAKYINYTINLFVAGIIIFCGSLYILAVSECIFGSFQSWLGAITPIGGLCFIAGWVFLSMAAYKK